MRMGLLLVCVVCLSASCRNEATAKAMSLISRLGESWKESAQSFAALSHQACAEIEAIANHSNRLECVAAYQESLLALPKYLRECDESGFWARLNAQTEIERIAADLDMESKWRFTVRWWQSLKEELEHYDAYEKPKPMRLVGGIADSEKMRKIIDKVDSENEIRRLALERRYYANRLRGCMRTMYQPIFEYALKEEWDKLPIERRGEVMRMIRNAEGKYPAWYQEGGLGENCDGNERK